MIRQLYKQGISISQIAQMTGLSRTTVRKYAKSEIYPKYKREKGLHSKLNPYKEFLEAKVSEAPYTATRLCREVKDKGYTGSYSVVKRYIRSIRSKLTTKAVWRFETEAGQQAQVDWGEFGKIKVDGKEYK